MLQETAVINDRSSDYRTGQEGVITELVRQGLTGHTLYRVTFKDGLDGLYYRYEFDVPAHRPASWYPAI